MSISLAGIVIGGAVMTIWGVLCLYGRCCEHRRRQWQARWNEFVFRQYILDAELERTWRRLKH